MALRYVLKAIEGEECSNINIIIIDHAEILITNTLFKIPLPIMKLQI
jgi:hypothetical protein